MSVEKVNLSSLRFLLFFYFGGVGCILPYLSLHVLETGLSLEDSRLLSIIAPLVAALGPILIGPLVDFLSGIKKPNRTETRTENNVSVRTVLATTVLLSTLFYCLLLAVPTIQTLPPRHPSVSFVCNENGASLVQEKCNECYEFPGEKTGQLLLQKCHFDCSYPAHYGYIEGTTLKAGPAPDLPTTSEAAAAKTTPYLSIGDVDNLDNFFGPSKVGEDDEELESGSGEESEIHWNKRRRRRQDESGDRSNEEEGELAVEGGGQPEPPHICHQSKRASVPSMCMVYTPNSQVVSINATLHKVLPDNLFCTYPLGGYFCRLPGSYDRSCKVICNLEDAYAPSSVLVQSQCDNVIGDPSFTFWTYLALRCLGDMFTATTLALLIGSTLIAARDEIGREFIITSIAYGLFAILIGYLHSETLSPLNLENIPKYFLGIVGFGLLTVCAVFLLLFSTEIPIGPPDWWWTTRNVQLRHKGEFSAVLFILLLLGVLWGPFYFHVPLQILKTSDIELYIGCSVAVGALLSVPFVWKAEPLIMYCGYSNVLILGFTFYILKYTGLLLISNPWVLLITGGLDIFTLCMMVFSAILYVRHLVPKHLTFTAQSWAFAAHFCLGNGLGCLIATFLSPSETQLAIHANTTTTVIPTLEEGADDEPADKMASPYHVLYVVGASTAVVLAGVYFIVYHCFLKKKCLAPAYRKEAANANLVHGKRLNFAAKFLYKTTWKVVVTGSTGNGTYTPLRIYRNGRQQRPDDTLN